MQLPGMPEAVFVCDAAKSEALGKIVSEFEAIGRTQYNGIESALCIRLMKHLIFLPWASCGSLWRHFWNRIMANGSLYPYGYK
jgi:hypothetical protein